MPPPPQEIFWKMLHERNSHLGESSVKLLLIYWTKDKKVHNSKSWKFLFTAGRHVIHTRVRLRTERQIQCDVIIGENLEGSVHLRKLRWEQIEHVQRDLESQEGQAISYNRIHLPAHNISGGCTCATSTNPGVNQPMRSLHVPWIARGLIKQNYVVSVGSRYGISELLE